MGGCHCYFILTTFVRLLPLSEHAFPGTLCNWVILSAVVPVAETLRSAAATGIQCHFKLILKARRGLSR
jgi:hypothetical protein